MYQSTGFFRVGGAGGRITIETSYFNFSAAYVKRVMLCARRTCFKVVSSVLQLAPGRRLAGRDSGSEAGSRVGACRAAVTPEPAPDTC